MDVKDSIEKGLLITANKEVSTSYSETEYSACLKNDEYINTYESDEFKVKEQGVISTNQNAEVKQVQVEVIDEQLKCELKSDKNDFLVGEIGHFYITIANEGNHSLKDVTLRVNIPEELLIIEDKIYIRNRTYDFLEIVKGVVIGDIEINETIVFEYYGKVKSLSIDKYMETYYTVSGYYKIDNNSERIYKEYKSYRLTNNINSISLKAFLRSDKCIVLMGQKIKYITTLINDGTLPIHVTYKLKLGSGMDEVGDYSILNGEVNKNNNLIQIKPNDGVVIEKEYVYKGIRGIDGVNVQGCVGVHCENKYGNYELYKEIKTVILKTEISNTSFEDVIVEEVIDTRIARPQIKEIIKIYSTPIIVDRNVRKIKRNYDYNSKNIMGYMLGVVGKIKYTIEYISLENNREIYLLSKEKIFTANIMLPKDFREGEELEIESKVLDSGYKIIDENKLFVNNNILISVMI